MIYEIFLTDEAKRGIQKHTKSGNQSVLKKIYTLFSELSVHPKTGIGKPEQLKGYDGKRWSRRIDLKHRLVYDIEDNELTIVAISTYGHYNDK